MESSGGGVLGRVQQGGLVSSHCLISAKALIIPRNLPLQAKLEKIWMDLDMPLQLKIDMAVKYCQQSPHADRVHVS